MSTGWQRGTGPATDLEQPAGGGGRERRFDQSEYARWAYPEQGVDRRVEDVEAVSGVVLGVFQVEDEREGGRVGHHGGAALQDHRLPGLVGGQYAPGLGS